MNPEPLPNPNLDTEDSETEEGDTPQELPNPSLDKALISEGQDSEMDKFIKHMLDPANLNHNTDLDEDEINAFSILGPLAIKHDIIILKRYMVEKKSLRVSKNRKGRGEFIKIGTRGVVQDEMKRPGLLDRFRL